MAGVGFSSTSAHDLRTDVTVDLRVTHQRMDGFGSSARVWVDPHVSNTDRTIVPVAAQETILRHLYSRLGLTRVRPVLDQGVQNRPGGPFAFQGKRADAHIELVKQARRHGLKSVFPGPVYVEPWIGPGDVDAYVAWAMAMLERWRSAGIELPLYAPQNEPTINGDFPPQWFHDVVVRLGQRMRAAGFKTKLVIPDDENPRDAHRRAVAVLSDPAARQYVAALAYHVYRWDKADGRDDIVRLRALGSRYKLPIWMTEYSSPSYQDWQSSFEWAERMHVLLTEGGVSAIDYMWGYFGNWVRSDTLVSIDFDSGVYRGHSFTPIYWLTGHYSRFVRPGYSRIAASPASASVLLSAYKGPKRVVVVATNVSGSAQNVRISIRGGAVRGGVRVVRSSTTEQWRTLTSVQPVRGSFGTTLPPRSIVTFVANR